MGGLQILTEPGTLLLVTLNAEQGIPLHAKRPEQPKEDLGPFSSSVPQPGCSNSAQGTASGGSSLEQPEAVSLLSGYVSFDQLADLMQQNQAELRRSSGGLDILMRGPGAHIHASLPPMHLHICYWAKVHYQLRCTFFKQHCDYGLVSSTDTRGRLHFSPTQPSQNSKAPLAGRLWLVTALNRMKAVIIPTTLPQKRPYLLVLTH